MLWRSGFPTPNCRMTRLASRQTRPAYPSAPQPCEQILGMDGLCEYLELVALSAGAVEQISGGGLAGEEQNLACRQQFANPDGGIDAVEVGHDDVADEHVGLEGAG